MRLHTPSVGWAGLALLAACCGLMWTPARAQTHKVARPENVVRAVGVYEWTGDMAKPTASRLIPVSVFVGNKFEDAAVYLARPMPFAILTGNVYELERAGVPLGTLDLAFAKHFVVSDASITPYDDGWFGYGKFLPPVAAKPSTLKASATLPKINGIDDDNDDRPHFSERSAQPGTGAAAAPLPGSASAGTPASDPASDPDRPQLHKASNSKTDASAGTDAGTTPDPSDPDRPTLRHRTPEQEKEAAKDASAGSVSAAGPALSDDPDRPTLHRGKPVSAMNEDDIPKLMGLPGDQDLHQMAAVSDAADRPVHDFARAWDDDAERQSILGKMQTAAREAIAAYGAAGVGGAPATATPTTGARIAQTQDTRHPSSKLRRGVAKQTAPPPPPEPLLEEQLTGYTLSYVGEATYIYYAHTDGLGAGQHFVTLVAQSDAQGELRFAMKNVTDAAHLDRTPRMRLVDAVDAEASNRASLLFELRGQNSRQFALYRVIGGRAEQTFVTGTTTTQ